MKLHEIQFKDKHSNNAKLHEIQFKGKLRFYWNNTHGFLYNCTVWFIAYVYMNLLESVASTIVS